MKNIHLLPTTGISKLYKDKDGLHFEEYPHKDVYAGNQHLYITSDEEPKQGEWCIDVSASIGDYTPTPTLNIAYRKDICPPDIKQLKIVLTTDPELIAHAVQPVQAVDEDFLQWYVKNPTCEYVKIADDTLTVDEMSKLPLGSRNHKYKIIISQEESKQECKGSVLEQLRNHFVPREELKPTYEEIRKIADEIWNEQNDLIKDKNVIPEKYAARQMLMMNAHEVIDTRVHKEETLEEAAKKYYEQNIDGSNIPREHWEYEIQDMMVGFASIWQSERMYSENDLRQAFKDGQNNASFSDIHGFTRDLTEEQWFEQFKKK